MKVFITGGSGFLGINLVRHLLAQGYEVVSYDIVPFDYVDCKDKITSVVGDVRDKDTLMQAVKGSDLVVHTAAALPLYSEQDILSTDIEGTTNVLDVAQTLRVDRVVFISSTAVYGIPDHHPLYEGDKLIGVGPYGKAKVAAEEVCLEYRKKGLCVPIIRPKSFIGPERLGVFALLYDWAKDGCSFPMIGNGKNRYQLLHVTDLCDAISACLSLPKETVNDTFNIGAKEFTTMGEDYQAVLTEAGFGKRIIGTPANIIIMILRLMEALKISPLYRWVYETAAEDSFVSIEKAEKTLGYQPKYSNKQALVDNYHWYLNHLQDFEGKSGLSHRVPWRQGALGLMKNIFRLL
ncbi:NAD-dependent epimerase/dehydratase family protein [Candidatus Woesebacteria bacterium]|nr:NAD-dependent epimerase/dehydratase family protein [Candidatus Woesebacteria bacterium]